MFFPDASPKRPFLRVLFLSSSSFCSSGVQCYVRVNVHGGRSCLTTPAASDHGPQCPFCGRFFTPNPRCGDRQVCCGRKRCRGEYKRRWRQQKYADDEAFREQEKTRVGEWREEHPEYWKRGGASASSDPPAVEGAVEEQMVRLEAVVSGLVLHTVGCRDREGLQLLLSDFAHHGRSVLASGG